MKDKEKPLVVVLSRNDSTGLSVIRSLGSAGYDVDLVASASKEGRSEIAACSKYVGKASEVVSAKVKDGGDTELVSELLRYAGTREGKILLFPTDDYTASVMDLNRSALEEVFIMPTAANGDDGCMTRLMDKTVQASIAKKAGLCTPREWIISLENEIVLPVDVVYPCFVKPIESITGYKREMARCDDPEALTRHLNKLRRKFSHRSILVQEFLEIDNEIDIGGVCLGSEVIIPAIIRKTDVAQYEKGVTLAGRLCPFEELGDTCDKIISMLREYGYVGMFDMELNIVGDKIYFNEVNLRSGGPNYSYFGSGVNLPALYAKYVFGEPISDDEKRVKEYGKSFIYEKVAWEDHINGYMSRSRLKACIAAADITILTDDNDPEPKKLFMKRTMRSLLRRRLRDAKKAVKKTVKGILFPILRPIKYFLLGYPQSKRKNRRDNAAEKPRVLVAGRNYCSNLCMARSLGKAGYEVEVLRIFQVRPRRRNVMKWLKPDAYSKYIKAYYVCVSKRRSRRIVNRLIKLAQLDGYEKRLLLVPVDDLVAYIIDENYGLLSEYYILPDINGTEGEVCRMMNKGIQKELAAACGLPVLGSHVIQSANGEFTIPDDVSYPCFIKPNVSKNSAKGIMRKCEDREELYEALSALAARKNVEILVEDYVEINREFSLLGLSTHDCVVGPGFFVAERGGQAEHRGVAVLGRLLDCDEYRELIDKLLAFVSSLRFNGLFDIDLIEAADGKMYFAEINLRYGASGYALTESGVNLPGMYADYMIYGKPIDPDCRIKAPGVTFVSEKIVIDEYSMGRMERREIPECLDAADISFIRASDDNKPYRHFRRFWPAAAVTRRLNAIRERRKDTQLI